MSNTTLATGLTACQNRDTLCLGPLGEAWFVLRYLRPRRRSQFPTTDIITQDQSLVKQKLYWRTDWLFQRCNSMIAIKLREAMESYRRRTGQRLTYEKLAEMTGIALGTLQSIGSRDNYNATLAILENICWALDTTPADLLELIDDRPKPKKGNTASNRAS